MRKKLMMFVAAFTLIFGMGLGTTSAYYPPPPPDDGGGTGNGGTGSGGTGGGSTGGGENCDPAPDGITLNKICPPER
ncbi:hypothetical protein [Cytobacillus sp. IB215316]|uniref:hypothetical protein n=1 Tax=Cytobacillus sp. IB215316 TaxID=3097354 RepID=UPI002A0DD506|nr:hypothetical protein [Cytobacillus sp. IB215316]MDX8362431.1 hypothetical protein [Cytobacillus sp. IB215316]